MENYATVAWRIAGPWDYFIFIVIICLWCGGIAYVFFCFEAARRRALADRYQQYLQERDAMDKEDRENLEVVSLHARYEWDCPCCGNTHDEGDIEPETVYCLECGKHYQTK